MITMVRRMLPAGLLVRYLLATVGYAVAEGAAFGLLVPLLTALLGAGAGGASRAGVTAAAGAARWLPALAGCVLVGWVAQYAMNVQALTLTSAWRRALYGRIGGHLVRLPLGWFGADRAGELERLVGPGVTRALGSVGLLQTLVSALLTPAVIWGFLAWFDPVLALAALVCVPVVLAVFGLGGRLVARAEAGEHAATATAADRLLEFAAAQPVLRTLGRGQGRGLDSALAEQHRAGRRAVFAALPGQHLGQLAMQLAFTAVLVVGVLRATGDALTAPRAVALLVLGVHFLRPLSVVADAAGSLRSCRAALARIRAVLDTPGLPVPDRPARLPAGPLDVELAGVRFGYRPGAPVLDRLDLRLPAGTSTALVGRSGAGKSTVTALVARFFDVSAGAVRIGGVDVRELAEDELRRAVSVVFQDVYLFDTTIEENIRAGAPGASREQVRAAARRARVDEIVARLPGGWAARVGEGGRLLSGGERQRVAIARALVKDAPIVLLDEATSALDGGNEAAVGAAVAELTRGRTLLVIAHRLDTVARADRIAVLDGGRVAELGVHGELVARGGRYAALWADHERARGWRLRS